MYSLWQPKKVSLIKQYKGVHRLVPSIMSLDLWNDYSIEVYLPSLLRSNDV